MWILNYYFSLWNHLQGEDDENLYEPLKLLSDSEKTKVIQLFENTIDQTCFATDDYNRLRSFFIDWNSSFRTLSTSQLNASELYSLPNSDLDELFRSFGYPYSQPLSLLNNQVNKNKVNFFLDLVNLYKIKGTPESILKVFTYYGIKRAEIYEYFIKRDPNHPNDFIFAGDKVAFSGDEILLPQSVKSFKSVTDDDPHWFYTPEQLTTAIEGTRIQLPSKTPYFSLRIYHDMIDTQATMALISRKITDDYEEWVNTGQLPEQSAFLTYFGKESSFLELYLLVIYLFNNRTKPRPNVPDRYTYYTKAPIDENFQEILDEYVELHNKGTYTYIDPITNEENERLLTRDSRKEKINQWLEDFSRPFHQSFLKSPEEVAQVFESINPNLKKQIDDIIDIQPFVNLFGPFIQDLQTWMYSYLGKSISNLPYLILGQEEGKRYLGNIIDFFKPYHARLMTIDLSLVSEDRLTDSILLDDGLIEKIEENTFDYITCDSTPCISPEGEKRYSRATYDCGSSYDLGAACDNKDGAHKLTIIDYPVDKLTCRNTLFTDEFYTQVSFVEDPITGEWKTVKTTINPSPRLLTKEFTENVENINPPLSGYETATKYMSISGGFTEFDCGACFDKQYANDICEVIVINH